MTERTIVKSINTNPSQSSAFVVSGGSGVINRIPPISKSLDIERLPGIEVGDILKCDGNPYLSKGGAIQSNPELLDKYVRNRFLRNWKPTHNAVQIGEEAWAIRKKTIFTNKEEELIQIALNNIQLTKEKIICL